MKWCNPCALVWVVLIAAFLANPCFDVHWTYCISAVVVLLPLIAVYVHQQREDIWWALQEIVIKVWQLLIHKQERRARRPQFLHIEKEKQ